MYRKMVENARQKGLATDRAMFASIARVDKLLEDVKEDYPEEYWCFIRKTHEDLFGCHYDEEFAEYDVSQMHSTGKDGHKYEGEHWSKEEVKSASMDKVFPAGTTDCDKYVAYNAMWHDMHKYFGDAEICTMAFAFFFADEDYEGSGKIWKYMNKK